MIARAFRRVGWDVYEAHSGPEARRLARLLNPELMVLAVGLEDESGWLTCEKLSGTHPRVKVFLVADSILPQDEDFATFVGAVGLIHADNIGALVEEVSGRTLPTV
jgi:DNA-binding response OmpR family regulator